MYLIESFLTKVTTFLAVFSSTDLQNVDQAPFVIPSHVATQPLSKHRHGPNFSPPGIPRESNFECKYPSMVDWENCSTHFDRKCWLRNKVTGKRYDINTNYEDDVPIGITRYYNLTLEDSWFSADGLNFTEAKLFRKKGEPDNQYPGPWIEACWGDRIVVNVTNKLTHNGTSVHWHGIRQFQTMHMDGVNGVTQCPIAPGDYFVYNFTATQYGSSWYHSHYSVQYADGAVGPMTLHGPTSLEFDEAISPPLILTDWGHNSAFVAVTSDLENPDILLNGHGNVTNFNNNITSTTEIRKPYHITFEGPKLGRTNKKYLLRIINTSFDTTFRFSIDNHMLHVVSADFVPIQPYQNQSILIGIGQRYNVIVEAAPQVTADTGKLDPDGNYWIRTEIAECFFGNVQGSPGYEQTGILRYDSSSKAYPTSKAWKKVPLICRDEDVQDLVPIFQWQVDPPPVSGLGDNEEEFEFWRSEQAGKELYPLAKWSLSDAGKESFSPLRVNYSDPTFFHLSKDNPVDGKWPPLWNIVAKNFRNKDWIYLVMQGNGSGQGAHPIHLHGHDFAILEQAYGKTYDPNNLDLILTNPPRRDVALLPRDGYLVIAFKADNPGAWLVHCHIAFHISEGLGMQIMEDQSGADALWPKGNSPALKEAGRVCKNWHHWQGNSDNWAVPPQDPLCQYPNHPDWCFQDDSGV